ncbi:MAG: hypothetical protein LBS32_03455, partial [Clostridiales Family XIII bacterium]|nr:hypothetical protein [Clostridiales Family XIII bacterium]
MVVTAGGSPGGDPEPPAASAGGSIAAADGSPGVVWNYGGTVALEGGQYAITPIAGYAIDEIWADEALIDPAGYAGGTGTYIYEGAAPQRNLSVHFAHTVNFDSPANGALSVVRVGGYAIESGDIVRDGEALAISATPDEGYALEALTLEGFEDGSPSAGIDGDYAVVVLASRGGATPRISASFAPFGGPGAEPEPEPEGETVVQGDSFDVVISYTGDAFDRFGNLLWGNAGFFLECDPEAFEFVRAENKEGDSTQSAAVREGTGSGLSGGPTDTSGYSFTPGNYSRHYDGATGYLARVTLRAKADAEPGAYAFRCYFSSGTHELIWVPEAYAYAELSPEGITILEAPSFGSGSIEGNAYDVVWGYGGRLDQGAGDSFTITPLEGYAIDEIWKDGRLYEPDTAYRGQSSPYVYSGGPPARGLYVSFAHTVNFQPAVNGSLLVSRYGTGSEISNGEIVYDGEILSIAATPASGYALESLTVAGLADLGGGLYRVEAPRGGPTPDVGAIRNCYNAGAISSTYACPTGGISGSNEIAIENCYNVGRITAPQNYAMGIGTNNSMAYFGQQVVNSYALAGTGKGVYFDNGKTFGEPLDGNYMKSEAFVNDLNSGGNDGAYAMDTKKINSGYPVLKWQGGTAVTPPPATPEGQKPSVDAPSTTTVIDGAAVTVVAIPDADTPLANGESALLVVNVDTGEESVNKITAEIPKEFMAQAAESKSEIEVRSEIANVLLPEKAVAELAAEGKDVAVKAEKDEETGN